MTVSAEHFKATCLQLMERVRRTRQPVTITQRGRAVARLVPVDDPGHQPLFGRLKGSVRCW